MTSTEEIFATYGASKGDSRPRVQSIARAVAILTAIAGSEHGLLRAEISERTGLSQQTTYHMLHTLVEAGMLMRAQDRRYVLGLRIASLGEAFNRQIAGSSAIRKVLQQIVSATGETAYAAKWLNGEIVSIDVLRGNHQIQALEVPRGFSADAHARAGGKILLAFASEAVREAYFQSHPLAQRTPNTITDRATLETELSLIRAQGYALEEEEFAIGLSCIGVPLDEGIGSHAIGISAPSERLRQNVNSYLAILRDVASRVFSGG